MIGFLIIYLIIFLCSYNRITSYNVCYTKLLRWGAGSKESVSLVYEDQVCAIIGTLDGRNGHLAEQRILVKGPLETVVAVDHPVIRQFFENHRLTQ